MLSGWRPLSKCLRTPASVRHGGGACSVPSRSCGPVEGDRAAHRCTVGRRMGSGEGQLEVSVFATGHSGHLCETATGKLFGPSHTNRSPAGPWREHTQYLLFQLLPSCAKDSDTGYAYAGRGLKPQSFPTDERPRCRPHGCVSAAPVAPLAPLSPQSFFRAKWSPGENELPVLLNEPQNPAAR